MKKISMGERARDTWSFECFKDRVSHAFDDEPLHKREEMMKAEFKRLTGREPDESVNTERREVDQGSEEIPPGDGSEDVASFKRKRKRTRRLDN